MPKRCLFPLLLCALHGVVHATEITAFAPLTSVTVPACSLRPGIRASHSGLVQLGEVSLSITAQAVREVGNTCARSAALWLTRGDISRQFEIGNDAAGTLAINDVSQNAASVLLSEREGQNTVRLAVLPLSDGSPKWITLSDMLGRTSCGYFFDVQGFVDSSHIAVAASPRNSGPNCAGGSFVYVVNPETHQVKAVSSASVARRAAAVSASAPACEADPDRSGACYTTRARFGLAKDSSGLVLWPVGSLHLMGVQDGMVPGDLRNEVTSKSRVYATVLVCPLVAPTRPRPFACIGSANDVKPELAKGARTSASGHTIVVLGTEH